MSMRANEPRGVANLDPRGMVGRIYVGDYLTLLLTKYLSSGPHGFREDFLSFFPNINLCELYVAMENRIPIRSAPKSYAAFPPSNNVSYEI